MQAYHIRYKTKKTGTEHSSLVDARDVKSAKKKIERKENDKITVLDVSVVGYY